MSEEANEESVEGRDTTGMTEAQKKLFALRLKINQSRKANKEEVEREYRRLKDPNYESKQRLAESYDQRLKEGKVMKKEEAILHDSAVRSDYSTL